MADAPPPQGIVNSSDEHTISVAKAGQVFMTLSSDRKTLTVDWPTASAILADVQARPAGSHIELWECFACVAALAKAG